MTRIMMRKKSEIQFVSSVNWFTLSQSREDDWKRKERQKSVSRVKNITQNKIDEFVPLPLLLASQVKHEKGKFHVKWNLFRFPLWLLIFNQTETIATLLSWKVDVEICSRWFIGSLQLALHQSSWIECSPSLHRIKCDRESQYVHLTVNMYSISSADEFN